MTDWKSMNIISLVVSAGEGGTNFSTSFASLCFQEISVLDASLRDSRIGVPP